MAANKENRNKGIFVKQILNDFKKKVTGEEENRVVGINPEDKFFVGKLSTIEEKNDMNSSKTFITQIGVDFLVRNDDLEKITLDISPKGEFYYRVNPTLKEQRSLVEKEFKITNEVEHITYEEIIEKYIKTKEDENKYIERIIPVYEKFKIDNSFDIKVQLGNIIEDEGYGNVNFEHQIKNKLDVVISHIVDKEDTFKLIRKKVRISDLIDENSWQKYLSSDADIILPRWLFSIEVDVKRYTDELSKVSVYIINKTTADPDAVNENKKANQSLLNDRKLITTIFNAGLAIKINGGKYQPIELDYFSDDYKYDRQDIAIGNNCSIVKNEQDDTIIETTNIPIFIQKKLKTKDNLKVKFKELMENPVETLNKVYVEMQKELNKLEEDYNSKKSELSTKAQEQFNREVKAFKFEIERFKNGIDKIALYSEIRQAFIYMNTAFSRSSKGYDTWRLFQIVFIVSLIPDICVSEYGEEAMGDKCKIDEVDVLYFPTGGGKTEAFLGATIFTVFFDRIRGKKAGISSIIKYPLRLLSVQQVQRVADILAVSEMIRKENNLISDSDVFSIGYYVGDVNTPNKLEKKTIEEIKKDDQETINDKYKVIDKCPFCAQTNVNIELDEKTLRLKHICGNKDCQSGGELPLYVVDREIYRYLPTVLISTIDKVAAIGYQPNFRNILGEVTHKCPVHGYTSKNKCTESEVCKKDIGELKRIEIKDAAPTLLIQDELHLVRESLGAFDGHYETFFQYMMSDLTKSNKKIKIIGATATISSYEFQLEHLYGKSGLRFPCESPNIKENFYSYIDEDEVHRMIIGYAPYAKAIINGVVYSMKYLKEVVWEYYKNPRKLIDIEGIDITTEEEGIDILKDYWFLLEYNNVKQDGNKVLGAIDTPINVELKSQGIQEFDYRKMTGDDTFQDVRKVLAEVENTENVFEGFNLIAATSMISHGVDADKFNKMLFFGMPGNTAEYIQAYSRAGRKYPGFVIVLLRPSRDKDISYLKHFNKFHEYKDILVDPVPINRWATKAIDKTLPGILQGLILNYYDKELQYDNGSLYMAKNVKLAMENKRITKEDLINHILRSYRCTYEDGSLVDLGKQYKSIVEESVNKVFSEILSKEFTNTDKLPDELEKILGNRVMTSLRDSEDQVKISLD